MVGFASGGLLGVEGARPGGVFSGLTGVLVEGLTQEGGTGIATLDPGLIAGALEHGSDTAELLHGLRAIEAVAIGTKGREQFWTLGSEKQ